MNAQELQALKTRIRKAILWSGNGGDVGLSLEDAELVIQIVEEATDESRAAAYRANVEFYERDRARIEQQIQDDAKRDDGAKQNGLA